MTEAELNSICNEIFRHLSGKNLKEAFSLVRNLVVATRQGEWGDKVYDLEENYQFLRKYTAEGVADPQRANIFGHLVRSLLELTFLVREKWLTIHSGSLFSQKKRSPGFQPLPDTNLLLNQLETLQIAGIDSPQEEDDLKTTPLSRESWQLISDIFYRIALIDEAGESEEAFITALFEDETLPAEARSIWVTALTFSLFRYFDPLKPELLLDIYQKNRALPMIARRALTGFLLAYYHYDFLLEFYPAIVSRFMLLNDEPAINRDVERVMLQLMKSRETEKIKQKIEQEILPEMIRISPNLRNKFNVDELMEAASDEDRNPEWSALFDDAPGLLDKMEEMARMQTEGADVFLASFGMFKNFPFFYELINWFVPFFPGHPDMPLLRSGEEEETTRQIAEALYLSPMLCNSDKYSLAMMLRTIPPQARTAMAGLLQAELEQFRELSKEEEILSPDNKAEIISNQYIQDLYRFSRLHPSGKEFREPLNWEFDFHRRQHFRRFLDQHRPILTQLAGFYFEKGYYEEALQIFELSGEQSGEVIQKSAFCHQKLGRFEKALHLYQKAEFYEVNKIWNLKKIALCHRNLKQTEEALKVYQSLEKLEPDNLNTMYALGYCYTETGRHQEALNAFFKIEYLSPGNMKVWRPIAWCSFLTGKLEQAEKYYIKLMEGEPDKYDMMNMGHVQWAMGKREAAVEYYRLSVKTGGFTQEELMASLREDRHFLLERGIPDEEIHILTDHLRYSLE